MGGELLGKSNCSELNAFPGAGTERFSEELLENENDRRIENVANKVSTLKHVSLTWIAPISFPTLEGIVSVID